MGFILRAMIAAIGLALATRWVTGISVDHGTEIETLLIAGALLGVVNAVVRPIAILLTLPFTLVTLGLFLLVINAAMLALVAFVLPGLHVAGFRPAFWGALIIAITGWIGSSLIGPRGRVEVFARRP